MVCLCVCQVGQPIMVTVEDKELVAALASFSLASSSPAPVAAAPAPAAGRSGQLGDICTAYNIYIGSGLVLHGRMWLNMYERMDCS